MSDFREMAQQPKFKRSFEKLLRLACQRGDVDLVRERLGWGIDPNCLTKSGRTPLIANVCSCCPQGGVVRALLKAGADPLTALDYARRKLARYQLRPRKPPPKSSSLDENGNLILSRREQQMLDKMRKSDPEWGPESARMYLQERLRAARKVFNDPEQIEKIVEILEEAERE